MKVKKNIIITIISLVMIFAMVLVLSRSCENESLYKENTLDLDLKALKEAVAGDGYYTLLEKVQEDFHLEEKGLIYDPLLRGLGRYLRLSNNILLIVYEYRDEQILYEDIYSIGEKGYHIDEIKKGKIIGGIDNEWSEQPHYYLYENLILIYVGENSDLKDFLKELSDLTIVE